MASPEAYGGHNLLKPAHRLATWPGVARTRCPRNGAATAHVELTRRRLGTLRAWPSTSSARLRSAGRLVRLRATACAGAASPTDSSWMVGHGDLGGAEPTVAQVI